MFLFAISYEIIPSYTNPVVISEKLELIAGLARIQALKEFGIDTVPAIILYNLTDDEIKALRLADNRIAEDGVWDFEILSEQLLDLSNTEFSFDKIGFDTIDYEKCYLQKNSEISQTHNNEKEDTSWLEENIPSRAKPGDLWRLANHLVYCGNSLESISYERVMKGELARIVITDPPYNQKINGHVCGKGKIKHEEFDMASGEMCDSEFQAFIAKYMENLIKFSCNGSLHYIYSDWAGLRLVLNEGHRLYTELKSIAVWCKGHGGIGALYRNAHGMVTIFKNGKGKHVNNIKLGKYGRYRTTVWEYPGVSATNPDSLELLKMHPCTKNIGMLHDILLDTSEENDVVLDCFGGSGSTLLAAERSKRRARLIEISPRYVDVIIYRFEKETGKTAKLEKNFGEVQDGEQ